MTNLFDGNASKIGTEYTRTDYSYCEDDNTYTPYAHTTRAWACPVVLKSQLTCFAAAADLYTELFGDA